MAKYHYDEAGNMAAYFLLTFLALILIPLSLSLFKIQRLSPDGCNCQPCLDRRKQINPLLKPYLSKKTYLLVVGWALFGYVSYKVANAKREDTIYDPFEILGIRIGTSEKDIKSHYKKLSRMYHPDKVKATVNLTVEAIQNRFVEITKAYKSLTDETTRENLEKYGHPDGRQDVSMGIALPQWIVERKNNVWVLGVYGLLFGGALPALVGRWWFGSRQKTKDGVHAQAAAAFFKSLSEESSLDEVIGTFGKAYQWELRTPQIQSQAEVGHLENIIQGKMGFRWDDISRLCGDHESRRKALVLIYAHLLRLPIQNSKLRKEQTDILLQAPLLLSALLNISIARSWLLPTLAVMRLHAFLAQAILPGADRLQFAQLPGIQMDELASLAPGAKDMDDFVQALDEKQDGRLTDVTKAMEKWGRIEIADAAFKVIGERIVTPSSIVFLVVKLRLSPPSTSAIGEELNADMAKQIRRNEDKDEEFLASRKEMEDIEPDGAVSGWAHAPYWPGERKPSWWLVLADEKSNRVVVPPIKISDVPFSRPGHPRNYRSYKIQFQAPQGVGMFTWKVQVISDTFVGEDVSCDISLKIEDMSSLNTDDQQSEDEISDPDEDTLAGQMAVMRGGAVKKRTEADEDSDEESSTDDDESDSSDDSD